MTTNHQDGPAPHVNDIVLLQAVELSKAIHARRVSCEEVMTAYLDHIEGINPTVNALVSLRPREELLREAMEKDRLLAQGRDMGWMHGFPHAVKDTADAAGFKTTRGFFHGRFDLPAARTDSFTSPASGPRERSSSARPTSLSSGSVHTRTTTRSA